MDETFNKFERLGKIAEFKPFELKSIWMMFWLLPRALAKRVKPAESKEQFTKTSFDIFWFDEIRLTIVLTAYFDNKIFLRLKTLFTEYVYI